MHDLEQLWSAILSRDPKRIQTAWDALDSREQAALRAHLTRMATEPGWTEPQRISAQAALDVLRGTAPSAGTNDDPSQ